MKARMLVGAVVAVAVMFALTLGPVFAGGPVCKVPPMCGPPMCGPQPYCGPPPCPPPCGPPPCAPSCEPNPVAKIFSGAFRLVTGVVALPFKLVDKVIDAFDCSPNPCCGPPRPMCGPPPCPPPVCGPVKCGPPPAAYGMAPPMRPVGYGAPRRMSPMSKKTNSGVQSSMMASPGEGVFGNYW